jgi:hypothetical protein
MPTTPGGAGSRRRAWSCGRVRRRARSTPNGTAAVASERRLQTRTPFWSHGSEPVPGSKRPSCHRRASQRGAVRAPEAAGGQPPTAISRLGRAVAVRTQGVSTHPLLNLRSRRTGKRRHAAHPLLTDALVMNLLRRHRQTSCGALTRVALHWQAADRLPQHLASPFKNRKFGRSTPPLATPFAHPQGFTWTIVAAGGVPVR